MAVDLRSYKDDHLDAYVFIHGAKPSDIRLLRRLVDHQYMAELGKALDIDFDIDPIPPARTALEKKADRIKAEIKKEVDAFVRSVVILAGAHDAVVNVTAASFNDLEKLVLRKIHKITPYTQTMVSLFPPALAPAPQRGAAARRATATGAKRKAVVRPPRHHADFRPISGAQHGGGSGQSWGPKATYKAVVEISVQAGTNPQSPTQKVLDQLFDKFNARGLFRGASAVAGPVNIVAMLGSNDYRELADALAHDLPGIKGIASYSISLNFKELPVG